MQVEEILDAFSQNHNQFPREMLEAAVVVKDEITPHLLTILERTLDEPEAAARSEGWAQGYAMYLLAQFRDARAYPLVAKIAALPGPLLDGLLGDTVTSGLHRILASLSGGDTGLITGLIENEEADVFARTAGMDALLNLVAVGIRPRDEVMGYFQSLFRGGLKRKPSFVWDYLISSSSDLYAEEVYEDIEKAFADGLALENVTDLIWIKQELAKGKATILKELRQKHHLVDDVIEEMEWWAWNENAREPEDGLLKGPLDWSRLLNANPSDDPNMFMDEIDAPQTPYLAPKKVGRNDPCPCGSGRKYKKCHGA